MNPSTAQARVLVDELVRHGVRDAVVCPGSRSAPLALAFAAAERCGALRLHVRTDERTAGFLALGLALGSGVAVPILVTSGTAVANLHPAMVEAALSGIPVLALTADRPPELRGTGANQTIDQVGLFGPHARAVVELPVAGDPATDHHRWRAALGRAVLTATSSTDPGPVQVDIPFREPLVPDVGDEDWAPTGYSVGAGSGDDDSGALLPGRPGGRPWASRSGVGGDRVTEDGVVAVDLTRPTVVVAGAGARPVPELVGVPTVAEPGAPSPLHRIHPLALAVLRPEQAVVLGRPTLHRQVTRLLADPAVDVTVLADGPDWPDPTGTAARVGTSVLTGWGTDPAWAAETARADESARRAVAEQLSSRPVTGLHVADVVARAARPGDHIVVGASNPVRDLALVEPVDPDVTVHSNRGAAGIDGTVSTAVGVAFGAPSRTLALMGDLTFLHDVAGLAASPADPRPRDLTIVVADDSGGGIFTLLEQGDPRLARDFERVFGTPPGVDIPALCAGYGVPCADVDLKGLAGALDEAGPSGVRVLRVRTDRSDLRALHERIRSGMGR